jgi:hypothetical protein
MHVEMKILSRPDIIRDTLHRDGWLIKKAHGDQIHAIHSEVGDEAAARVRLFRLGLLTSSSLRIEFPLSRSR